MTTHRSFNEALTLVNAGVPILLSGDRGSGKTTLAQNICDHRKMKFFSVSMTRQTTLSHLLGYLSVSGEYVTSQLRICFEHGGLMLIDEIDGGDPNVLLCLNTIENGYISFPDGIVKMHDEFRLIATANPADQHAIYTGRTKLDAATLDRFDKIDIPLDENLEQSLVDEDTFNKMRVLRGVLKSNNASQTVSMRDSIRYQKRKELELLDGFIERLLDGNELIIQQYNKAIKDLPKFADQSECRTYADLVELVWHKKS